MIREEDLEKLCEVWFKVMEFTIIVSILTYLSQQHFSFRIDFAVSILKFASYILLNIYFAIKTKDLIRYFRPELLADKIFRHLLFLGLVVVYLLLIASVAGSSIFAI